VSCRCRSQFPDRCIKSNRIATEFRRARPIERRPAAGPRPTTGMVIVARRQSAEGDPDTNLYTVLDPSPDAVAKRLREREEAERGGGSTQRPGGGSTQRPPSPQTATTLIYSDLEQNSLNEERPACAEEMGTENPVQASTVDTPLAHPDRQPCTHSHDECDHFDSLTICRQCWTLVDHTKAEEGQAHSATRVACTA